MRRRIVAWAWVWAGWTALALFFALSTSLTYRSTGRAANWSINIGRALSEWWLWALLTPLVVWLARRFPLHGPSWRRSLGVHLVTGTAIAMAKTAADRVAFALLTGFWLYWLFTTLALQFVVYGAVVAAAHGREYYRRSRDREQLERTLAETRLQLLNMQLQPHFLFNTLNTIAELVHEDADAADRMITSLSELLRRTLELGASQEIPLSAELALLDTYLDIQRTRFGERLDVRVDVDEEVHDARVPILLLQPIVENAIRHGLAPGIGSGVVEITARRSGPSIVIEVTDEGLGVPAFGARGRAGIGLGNTRERLDALYAGSSSLDLSNAAGRGARVTVRLPFRAVESI
jgi:two-component system, LytTR family, sensor kinase